MDAWYGEQRSGWDIAIEQETDQRTRENKISGLKELGLFNLGQRGLKTVYKNTASEEKVIRKFKELISGLILMQFSRLPQHQSCFYILYTIPCLFRSRLTASPSYEKVVPGGKSSLF